MKRTSKYLNRQFGKWVCTNVFLAANYGGTTRHNAYRYQLKRITSDGKCLKCITVSGSTMVKIARGETSIEDVVKNKKKSTRKINEVLYQFN